jgi:DNA polymerase
MSKWKNLIDKLEQSIGESQFCKPDIPQHTPDWDRLVAIDFETYYDTDYTLKKLSTSEYIRDPRFKAQMMGIKVGNGKTRVIPGAKIRSELAKINWRTHSCLCHHTQFDGFILSHHYDVRPSYMYDSLSMARGLHSNDIGGGLDEVSRYYGGGGKLEGTLEKTKGVLVWNKELYNEAAIYCANDVDEMLRVFKAMLPKMPADEMDLINLITRMFTDPVLRVDIPRVEKELERELAERKAKLYAAVDPADYDVGGDKYDPVVYKELLKTQAERDLEGEERDMLIIKRVIGSSEKFAGLLRVEGIKPPTKISPAWMKLNKDDRESPEGLNKKYSYAFAKDDIEFLEIPNKVTDWGFNLNDTNDVQKMAAKQARLQSLIDVRIAVKSTTNITRAKRFLEAGKNGMPLPVGYAYYRAHTGRLGGQNKMNMQNLQRGGELRLSILAPKGHMIAVVDSGQIEARVNAWLWGQDDLLEAFRAADSWNKKTMGVATGDHRDAYCRFADAVYGREITTNDELERFVGKVCVLGLGYQMGAPKFQLTLAKGALGGPPVHFSDEKCKMIVNTYRLKNSKIVMGWKKCERIIEDMAAGRTGAHGPISWEANTIWLPNGMALKYPDLKKQTGDKGWDEWTYQSGDMRKKIYSGLLNENIVQALARIIVMWQMLQVSRKYRVVMTTHDEFCCVIKIIEAQKCFQFMTNWMKTPPDWCGSIPLNSDGKVDINYSK